MSCWTISLTLAFILWSNQHYLLLQFLQVNNFFFLLLLNLFCSISKVLFFMTCVCQSHLILICSFLSIALFCFRQWVKCILLKIWSTFFSKINKTTFKSFYFVCSFFIYLFVKDPKRKFDVFVLRLLKFHLPSGWKEKLKMLKILPKEKDYKKQVNHPSHSRPTKTIYNVCSWIFKLINEIFMKFSLLLSSRHHKTF